jgi:hypothetical protein
MAQPLVDFISSIRQAENAEEERQLISCEQADMRTYIRTCDPEFRPRVIAKIIFLSNLGETVAYGQMEILTLMSHERLSYKRVAYVAAGLLLDESSELTVLLTHTVLKDLKSGDANFQCLALSLLANIATAEMCNAAAPEVQRLSETGNSAIMKRAAMAACRMVDRMPDLAESFRPVVQRLLKHGSHSVVIAALHLVEHMVAAQPALAATYQRYQASLTKILRQLSQTRAPHEFAFNVFNDPFLQMRIMSVLARLKRQSDELDDVLAGIVTGVDIKRNTGRSLLFHAVEAIVASAKKQSLRALGFSQIGRLFQSKESNVLYSALSVFSRVLYFRGVDRSSGDSIALQRYKTLIVQCLNHRDASIRRRALDVVSALVAENNVQSLVPEVLDYVKLADADFRAELVAKLFTAVQRFAPSVEWNFDTVLRIIVENGSSTGADLITSFCSLIVHNPQLQSHAVAALSAALLESSDNQTLVQVAAWGIGEFGGSASSYETLKRVCLMPQTTDRTRSFILTAVAKLAARFSMVDDCKSFLVGFRRAAALDLQQRAGELLTVLGNGPLCAIVLAPVECVDEKESGQPKQVTLVETPAVEIAEPPAEEPVKAPTGSVRPFPGAVEAMRRSDYVIYFEVKKNPQNVRQLAIRASVFNLGKLPFRNFAMKFGVPPGWRLQAQPPSGNVLEPVGGKPILQQIVLGGQGDAKLQMKTQLSYLYGSQPVTETGEINPIFD